jgi:hypothetical protein
VFEKITSQSGYFFNVFNLFSDIDSEKVLS